jgi:hypothetical protein
VAQIEKFPRLSSLSFHCWRTQSPALLKPDLDFAEAIEAVPADYVWEIEELLTLRI